MLEYGPLLMTPTSDRRVTIVSVLPQDCADYEAVVSIRRAAYGAAGKLPKENPDEVVRDRYDPEQSIYLLRVDSRPVGTVRVCLCPDKTASDYSQHPEFSKFAHSLSEVSTASRLAIIPERRGLLNLRLLLTHVARISFAAGRPKVLGSCETRLVSLYQRFGWQPTGVTYAHMFASPLPHEFIVLDTRRVNAS